jgi:hypothetical protein
MLSVKSALIAIAWTPWAPVLFPALHSLPIADLADAWNKPSCNDSFTDIGIDTQYRYLGDPHSVTVRAAWIHENHNTSASQTLGLADNSNNTLRSLNVSASLYLRPHLELYGGADIDWRHRGCNALRHFHRKLEQRQLDHRDRVPAVQLRRPRLLAVAEHAHRIAVHSMEQLRRRHHQHQWRRPQRAQQQHDFRLRLDHVLIRGDRCLILRAYGLGFQESPISFMAGLEPAIHVFLEPIV